MVLIDQDLKSIESAPDVFSARIALNVRGNDARTVVCHAVILSDWQLRVIHEVKE
jgi:hypothetical protein